MEDNQEKDIEQGQISAFLKMELSNYVKGREERIVSRLVGWYQRGELNNERMLSGIAGIAELRELLTDIDFDIAKGQTAMGEVEEEGNQD